jgi:MFS family permease
MMTVAIVLSLLNIGYDYFHATLLSALMWIGCALSSPFISRMMDSMGYKKILYPFSTGFIASVFLFIFATREELNSFLLVPITLIMGMLIPSYGGVAIRGIWQHNFTGKLLQASISWESMLDDVIYTAGPMLGTLLFYKSNQDTLWLVIAMTVACGILLAPKEFPLSNHENNHRKTKILSLLFFLILVFSMTYGAIFGSMDIVIIARYKELSLPALAGVALGTYALASAIGALVYGLLPLDKVSTVKQFSVFAPLMVVFMIPFSVFGIHSALGILLTLFISGMVVAPNMILLNTLTKEIVPKERLLEAISWLYSALNLGTAMGALSIGEILDRLGGVVGALIPLLLGSIALVFWLIFIQTSKRIRSSATP